MSQGIFGVGDNDFETKDSAFDLFSKPVLNDDYYTFNDFTSQKTRFRILNTIQ